MFSLEIWKRNCISIKSKCKFQKKYGPIVRESEWMWEGAFFQVLDDIEIVADTTKFDSHQMAFQWLSDLLLYEDLRTYCLGGTLFYYTIEAAVERPRSHSRTQRVLNKSQNMSMLLITSYTHCKYI